jgi:acetyl-CoA carboxylase carboxyl transferase subunit alpha
LWGDKDKVKQAARALNLTSKQLDKLNVIDQIVGEPLGGAHRNHKWAAIMLKKALRSQLKELMALKPSELVEQRQDKFRNIGVFNTEKE